jgi:hypothetical protein
MAIVHGFRASPKRLSISFLNARNRYFSEKNPPTASLNDHPNIAIFYSEFFARKKKKDENGSLACA